MKMHSYTQEQELYSKFKNENKPLFNQPIIISFFNQVENKELLIKLLKTRDENYIVEIDNAFRKHFRKARLVKYISNLAHFYAIDFDKKERKHRERYLPILSQPLSKESSESSETYIDQIVQRYTDEIEEISRINNVPLEDQLQDEFVHQAMKRLNPKQKEVLNLIYNHQFKLKEIAKLNNKSPQSISQLHKHALKKLKEEIISQRNNKGGEHYDNRT